MTRTISVVAFVLVLAVGLVLYFTEQPSTAKDLGVAHMSQYQLACHILDNAARVEDLRLRNHRQALKLAMRNKLIAGFVTPYSAWHEIVNMATSQYYEIAGPNSGGFNAQAAIDDWELKLHGGFNHQITDARYMAELPNSISDMDVEHRRPQMIDEQGRTDMNETLRQWHAEELRKANVMAQDAKRISEQSCDPLPDWVARAIQSKAQANMLLIWELRTGMPAKALRLKYEAKCLELVKLAADYNANNHLNLIDSEQLIQNPAPPAQVENDRVGPDQPWAPTPADVFARPPVTKP